MVPTPAPASLKPIDPKQLQECDVLLSCGDEPISQVIRRIDGGLYSHAGIWHGNMVVEARRSGVTQSMLKDLMDDQWYVDVYRWHPVPDDGGVFGDQSYPYGPVGAEASKLVQLGAKFAMHELFLAGLVIAMSKVPRRRWLRIAVRIVLGQLEQDLHNVVVHFSGPSMVCADVVYMSFINADPSLKYEIQLSLKGLDMSAISEVLSPSGAVAPAAPQPGYEGLKRRYGRRIMQSMKLQPLTLPSCIPGVASQAIPCISPRMLETSPNLQFIGRLSERSVPPITGTPLGILLRLAKEKLLAWLRRVSGGPPAHVSPPGRW